MNLKNHTTPRYWELSGDRGENPTYAHGSTFKWNLKDIPAVTRDMCNYLVGLIVFVTATFSYTDDAEGRQPYLDSADIARALFESCEVQQTMFGTPVSPNHFLGKYMGLFGFIANGMQTLNCETAPIGQSTTAAQRTYAYFVPLSMLLGMKGHHTAQPACCYDRAQFILRTAASGTVHDFTVSTPGELRVVAVLNPEPELRLGPGTSFMRYTQAASASGTIVNVDALGNSSTLEGIEPGAGIAAFLWMGGGSDVGGMRKYGGPGDVGTLEYVSAPFRDLQMIRNLDPFIIDWQNACAGAADMPYVDTDPTAGMIGGGHHVGYMYPVGYRHGSAKLIDHANFLPLITPHKFLETSKLQVVQGTQQISLKSSASFSGEHVFAAAQYHSWTPAKQEEVLRKLVDSGVARAVWGTNDLVPKIKVTNKQPSGSLNPTKKRFFAMTWEPREKVSTPPGT